MLLKNPFILKKRGDGTKTRGWTRQQRLEERGANIYCGVGAQEVRSEKRNCLRNTKSQLGSKGKKKTKKNEGNRTKRGGLRLIVSASLC